MEHSTLLAHRPDPLGLLPDVGTPGEKLKLAVGKAMLRARRLARTVTTRVAPKSALNQAGPRVRAPRHGGESVIPITGLASGGGGMSIEMWRADDGGRAVLQSRLQRGVFDEFVHEPTLDAADIRVVVDGRVVTLLGTVKRYPDKLAAERAAKRVRGVQMVRDELAVMPPSSG
jgi:hypothetical protein